MAQYEYTCEDGHYNLIERPMSAPEGNPTCGTEGCSKNLRRIYSTPAIQFKGKGFYKTGG